MAKWRELNCRHHRKLSGMPNKIMLEREREGEWRTILSLLSLFQPTINLINFSLCNSSWILNRNEAVICRLSLLRTRIFYNRGNDCVLLFWLQWSSRTSQKSKNFAILSFRSFIAIFSWKKSTREAWMSELREYEALCSHVNEVLIKAFLFVSLRFYMMQFTSHLPCGFAWATRTHVARAMSSLRGIFMSFWGFFDVFFGAGEER
jgi:hypothetical protein